jgi:hypothetical protein
VFDFGVGPGIDARWYAEHGLRVFVYDIDPRMSDYLAARCHDFIVSGTVKLRRGSYQEFLAGAAPAAGDRVELVTSNFVPLNLIDDLPQLFVRLAALHHSHWRGARERAEPLFRRRPAVRLVVA